MYTKISEKSVNTHQFPTFFHMCANNFAAWWPPDARYAEKAFNYFFLPGNQVQLHLLKEDNYLH